MSRHHAHARLVGVGIQVWGSDFNNAANYAYLTIASPSCHDMTPCCLIDVGKKWEVWERSARQEACADKLGRNLSMRRGIRTSSTLPTRLGLRSIPDAATAPMATHTGGDNACLPGPHLPCYMLLVHV